MHPSRSKTLVSLVATSALILGGLAFAVPANAAPVSASAVAAAATEPEAVTLTAQQTTDVNAISAASDTVNQSFDATSAVQAGASETAVADAAAVLSTGGWTVTGAVDASASVASQKVVAAAAACAGSNGYQGYFFPIGSQFASDSCNTTKIIAAVGLGIAGAGVVTAALVLIGVTAAAAPVAGLVTAIIAFGAAALVTCQAFSSNGAILINLGGAPTASCWGQ